MIQSNAWNVKPSLFFRLELWFCLVVMMCAKNKFWILQPKGLFSKKNIIDTIVTVIDAPYSKATKQDFFLLFDYARQCNCLNSQLLSCLVDWDKKDVQQVLKEYIEKNNIVDISVQDENVL